MTQTFLGATGIPIPPLGLGTWQWGDRVFWGYGKSHTEADLAAGFHAALEAGVSFFDTAEIYAQGQSEALLGRFIRAAGRPVVVGTKFMPWPWRLGRGRLRAALRRSLRRLGLERVDLYYIHWPTPPVPIETWVDALADAVQEGLVRAAGISNYSLDQTLRAHEVLARRGIPLAAVQVQFNLLSRGAEANGLLRFCREHNVTLVAYSPLAQGLLTGKYTGQNLPAGLHRRRWGPRLARVQPLVDRLREIGAAHGGKTPSQVALNWVICKGAVPIPGVKNARQAQENAGALGWRLSEAEVAALDEAGPTTNGPATNGSTNTRIPRP